MPTVWISTLTRLALFCLAGLGIGWLYDEPLAGLLLATAVALAWNLLWLYRLDRWLHGERKQPLPDGSGVWSQVFARSDFIRVRNKQRRKLMKQLLKQMRQATRSFPDGGVILNAEHEIVSMNRAAEQLLGLKRKQDRGLRIETLIRDPDFVNNLQSGDKRPPPVEFGSPVDHERWLSCHQVPYGIDQNLLLIKDITPQRQAEQMRRDFVANASHELRTPLTVVTGYLDVLADDPMLGEELRQPVAEMLRQSNRMRLLVDDLLHLSELESKGLVGEGKPVNLPAILAAARQEARAIEGCPQSVEMEIESTADLRGDERDIQSILTNLVSNAVKYTPADGKITIRWTVDDRGGHLAVIDTGMGIAKQHLQRLTERFYRVEGGRERIGGEGGTGLGLAIVKHALQRHSAQLEIASHVGRGSRFTCHFPKERIVIAGQLAVAN
jgi:two-component system phosphate regulon sensor histidine kinase PhoR